MDTKSELNSLTFQSDPAVYFLRLRIHQKNDFMINRAKGNFVEHELCNYFLSKFHESINDMAIVSHRVGS